jgi:hypothetical protein
VCRPASGLNTPAIPYPPPSHIIIVQTFDPRNVLFLALPIALHRYKLTGHNPGWGVIRPYWHLLRLMTQVARGGYHQGPGRAQQLASAQQGAAEQWSNTRHCKPGMMST